VHDHQACFPQPPCRIHPGALSSLEHPACAMYAPAAPQRSKANATDRRYLSVLPELWDAERR